MRRTDYKRDESVVRHIAREDHGRVRQAGGAGMGEQPLLLIRRRAADNGELMGFDQRRGEGGECADEGGNVLSMVDAARVHEEGAREAQPGGVPLVLLLADGERDEAGVDIGAYGDDPIRRPSQMQGRITRRAIGDREKQIGFFQRLDLALVPALELGVGEVERGKKQRDQVIKHHGGRCVADAGHAVLRHAFEQASDETDIGCALGDHRLANGLCRLSPRRRCQEAGGPCRGPEAQGDIGPCGEVASQTRIVLADHAIQEQDEVVLGRQAQKAFHQRAGIAADAALSARS